MRTLTIPFIPFKSGTGAGSAQWGGHQSYALGAAVFQPNQPIGANLLLVQALTQNARYTLDGTTPTASVGFQLKAGDPPRYIEMAEGVKVIFFREAAGAVLEFNFGKSPDHVYHGV